MIVIDPGHDYHLQCLDIGTPPPPTNEVLRPRQRLTFVKREGEGYPGNVGHHEGTTLQEVMRALIERVEYVNNQIPDRRNLEVLKNLRDSIYLLEERAAERHGRVLELTYEQSEKIEDMPTCPKCGHIGCLGDCH